MSWIDDLIDEGERIYEEFSIKEAKAFIRTATGLLSDEGVDRPKVGLKTEGARIAVIGPRGSFGTTYSDEDYRQDVRTVVVKLRRLRESMERRERVALAGSGGITITNNNAASADARAHADASVEFRQQWRVTREAIRASDELDEGAKLELVSAIDEARDAAEDSDHVALADRLSRALDVARQGAGVVRDVLALVPTVIALLPKG